jgi:uncharacterized phage protein (TIGR02218 family)
MKTASPALIALLVSRQFIMADLYTITTIQGGQYFYTSYDYDLVVNGHTFNSGGLIIERSSIRIVIGVEVDTLDVTVKADNSATSYFSGTPFIQVVHNGGLDGARIKLERVFMGTPGDTSAGTVLLFEGRVADVECSRTMARLKVNSDLELLNIQMPRNLYQPGCIHNLYDTGCGLTKSSWAVGGAVSSVLNYTGVASGLSQPDGYFDNGVLIFNSGTNAQVRRTVKKYAAGIFTFSTPLKVLPSAGDTFTAYPGCDKTQVTCTSKFSNVIHFRGYPYIPIPETAI